MEFNSRITNHAEHVKANGVHCTTEETTKQALILPFLDILGFNPFDPTKVKAEYGATIPGIKAGERVDYALFVEGQPVMFIEAKPCSEKLTNHTGQIARYFNATPGVKIAAVTNGREWRFFTDLNIVNIMDQAPFLAVNFENIDENSASQLTNFRYDQFQPDKLKSFAEERRYIDIFTGIIRSCLRDVDQEFVKFLASRANLEAKLSGKFLESIAPVVKQAVAAAISDMVVSGLSIPPQERTGEAPSTQANDDGSDWSDPANPKIVTTAEERTLVKIVGEILEGTVEENGIIGKDTESYFTILYRGKVNRWLLRYVCDRKKPTVTFCIELTDQHKTLIARAGLEFSGNSIVLPRPENIMKLSPLLFDALAYCEDDNNFRNKKKADIGGSIMETR